MTKPNERNIMSRRGSTVLALATSVAMALPLGGAAVADDNDADQGTPGVLSPDNTATTELYEEALAAAEQAGAQHGASSRGRVQAPGAGLDAAAQALVADGAFGVTARTEAPGFSWRGSAGVSELDGRPPAHPSNRFRVASITKTMVATVVMQEVEAGTFSLDTPVETLVPGLFPDHPEITIEHLLTHRSGAQTGTFETLATRIEDPADITQFIDALGQDYTDQEHIDVVNTLPWKFEPGTSYSYSNAGYIALGMILEEVTGEDLTELLEERVFKPAGMRHTSFPDEPGTRGPFLVGAMYTGPEDQGGLGWVSLEGFDPDVFSAAGAAVSTTEDLDRFTEALITGELVDPTTVNDMIVPRSDLEMEYGLGIYRLPDPCTPEGEPTQWLYGHDGGAMGTVSIALTSADGSRQLSFGVTGRDMTTDVPPYDISLLLVPMMLATC